MTAEHPIICLLGPTASGKTQLAIALTKIFPYEIISVDSALVYRGMDIGTAKPSAAMLTQTPHHLLNIRDPGETYSAAQFCEDALRVIPEIFARNHTPLLVGGTMLYFKALQQGLSVMPCADPALRAELTAQAEKLGWSSMHARLAKIDSEAAARIHPNDAQRIQRALEVYELTGKNITAWQQDNSPIRSYDFCNIAIAPSDRAILHARIEQRFSEMLEQGLVEEVQALFARGDLTLEMPAMRSVGYRQVWEYLEGKYSFEEMRTKGIAATRQFAKRQLTWLRTWPKLQWFDSEAPDLQQQVAAFLTSKG